MRKDLKGTLISEMDWKDCPESEVSGLGVWDVVIVADPENEDGTRLDLVLVGDVQSGGEGEACDCEDCGLRPEREVLRETTHRANVEEYILSLVKDRENLRGLNMDTSGVVDTLCDDLDYIKGIVERGTGKPVDEDLPLRETVLAFVKGLEGDRERLRGEVSRWFKRSTEAKDESIKNLSRLRALLPTVETKEQLVADVAYVSTRINGEILYTMPGLGDVVTRVLDFVRGAIEEVEETEETGGILVKACARCGKNHKVKFLELGRPVGDLTHWTRCPNTGEPILMHFGEEVGEG